MSIYGHGLQNHKITDKQKNYLGGATQNHRCLSGTTEEEEEKKKKNPQSLMGIEQRGNKNNCHWKNTLNPSSSEPKIFLIHSLAVSEGVLRFYHSHHLMKEIHTTKNKLSIERERERIRNHKRIQKERSKMDIWIT